MRPEIHTTPGTRVSFHDVSTWVAGLLEIHQRAASAQRYRQRDAHVAALSPELLARERDAAALQRLVGLFRHTSMGLQPPRGSRAGTAYERVITQANNRLAALQRAPRLDPPARIVEAWGCPGYLFAEELETA